MKSLSRGSQNFQFHGAKKSDGELRLEEKKGAVRGRDKKEIEAIFCKNKELNNKT